MSKLRVLVGCEESGTVREAFLARGHDAWSCDLKPSRRPGPHFQEDIFKALRRKSWDLLIAHPPCTHLSLSGARWCVDHWVKNRKGDWWWDGAEKRKLRDEAVQFFKALWEWPDVDKLCLENPMSMASSLVAPFTQCIHPWQFGHGERKTTWLWLRNLPLLKPTKIVEGRKTTIWSMPPSADRGALRSVTFPGIARAMAIQWGG